MASKRQRSRHQTRRPVPPRKEAPAGFRRIGGTLVVAGRLASVALIPAAFVAPALASASVPAGSTADRTDTEPVRADLTADIQRGVPVLQANGWTQIPGTRFGFLWGLSQPDPSAAGANAVATLGFGLTQGDTASAAMASAPSQGLGFKGIIMSGPWTASLTGNVTTGTIAFTGWGDVAQAPSDPLAAVMQGAKYAGPNIGGSLGGTFSFGPDASGNQVTTFTPASSIWQTQAQNGVAFFGGAYGSVNISADNAAAIWSWANSAATWVDSNVTYKPATPSSPASGYIIWGSDAQPVTYPSLERDLAAVQSVIGFASDAYSTIKGWLGYSDSAPSPTAPADRGPATMLAPGDSITVTPLQLDAGLLNIAPIQSQASVAQPAAAQAVSGLAKDAGLPDIVATTAQDPAQVPPAQMGPLLVPPQVQVPGWPTLDQGQPPVHTDPPSGPVVGQLDTGQSPVQTAPAQTAPAQTAPAQTAPAQTGQVVAQTQTPTQDSSGDQGGGTDLTGGGGQMNNGGAQGAYTQTTMSLPDDGTSQEMPPPPDPTTADV
jgi:hypothetical protein